MQRLTDTRLFAAFLYAALAATTVIPPAARADSTSSAASSASTAAGSASQSLGTSSNSSSRATGVAQGAYTVLDVAAVENQPHLLQLTLQAQADAATVLLRLPRLTAERERLAAGQTVVAQLRSYGLAFAIVGAGGQPQPFFLVLDDGLHRELHNRPLGS